MALTAQIAGRPEAEEHVMGEGWQMHVDGTRHLVHVMDGHLVDLDHHVATTLEAVGDCQGALRGDLAQAFASFWEPRSTAPRELVHIVRATVGALGGCATVFGGADDEMWSEGRRHHAHHELVAVDDVRWAR